MKRVLVSLTVIIILFNFIFANDAYAAGSEPSDPNPTKMETTLAEDDLSNGVENTKAADMVEGNGNEKTEDYGPTIIGLVVSLLGAAINLLAFQVDIVLCQLSYSTENDKLQYFFSIERAVFNRVPLFNINFFSTDDPYTVGSGDHITKIAASQSINDIKVRVAQVFYVVRLIATGASLVVLVYIGIRMSLSTLSDDKAKYKKMLIGWVESIVVLFLLEYIMVAIIMLGEMITNVFYNMEMQILSGSTGLASADETFENVIRSQILTKLFEMSGLNYALYTIMYICLLVLHVKYFWTYMKRFLMVGFLIMIAPMITVTYGIDKAGDGKAQAFSVWMKEFTVNVLIQPLHALIYLIFALSAGEIAKLSPIIALAFLMCMGAVERMVKVIFDLRGLVSLRGVDKFGKKQ